MFHIFLSISKIPLSNPLKPDSFINMGKKYFGGFKHSFDLNKVKKISNQFIII